MLRLVNTDVEPQAHPLPGRDAPEREPSPAPRPDAPSPRPASPAPPTPVRPALIGARGVVARAPSHAPSPGQLRAARPHAAPPRVRPVTEPIDPREAEVARANAEASRLSVVDPRWVLAVRAAHAMEGGRAAILRPEARRRLVDEGKRLGLRPFDANLVIAIVQDGARCGEGALGPGVAGRVTLIRKPAEEPVATARAPWAMLALSALLALAMTGAIIAWIVG